MQSAEEWDITFHQAIIRGTFQRDPAASEGLLKAELSEMHQYSLRAVCLLSIPWSWLQESSPQTGYNLLWREFLSCWKRGKINSTRLATYRKTANAGSCTQSSYRILYRLYQIHSWFGSRCDARTELWAMAKKVKNKNKKTKLKTKWLDSILLLAGNCIMVRHNYLFSGLSKHCLFIYVFNLYIGHSLSMEIYNFNNCIVNLWWKPINSRKCTMMSLAQIVPQNRTHC